MFLRPFIAGLLLSGTLAPSVDAADNSSFPTLGVVARVAGVDGFWDYASVNPNTHTFFLGRANGVMAINLDTNAVTAQFVPGDRVHGVIALGDTGLEASANGGTNTVTLFDPATGSVKASIATGQGPDALAFDSGTDLLVALDGKSQDATVIDPKTQKVAATIPLGGRPEFAAGNGAGLVYDNLEDKNEIAVIDLKARNVSRRIPLSGCEGPGGLAYDKADDLVISACHNHVAKFIDGASGAERASIAIGDGPDAVIYDDARRVVYIPCGGSGTLSVISVLNAKNISLVGAVATQKGARTGAVDLRSGRVYLPTAQFQPATEPGKRPTALPGTFEVLVVGPRK
ncbi:MAG: YncE family protein [Rhizomicrobium sp.]|jgi:YVTN family beta-propeller protein